MALPRGSDAAKGAEDAAIAYQPTLNSVPGMPDPSPWHSRPGLAVAQVSINRAVTHGPCAQIVAIVSVEKIACRPRPTDLSQEGA
eukprot:2012276-Prymnesium_polylepis.1